MAIRYWGCALVVLGTVCAARGHDELLIGRNSSNQLVIHFHQHEAIPMLVSVFPGYPGWAAFAQGFESLPLDDPDEDVFTLDPASDLEFVVFSQDKGIRISNDNGSGFVPVGGAFHLGMPFFDFHPIWNIYDGVPGIEYTIEVFARDRSGISTDSEPVAVTFTPVRPAAGDADGNGAINAADISVFVEVLLGVDDDPVHEAASDVSGNGSADGDDVGEFVAAWMAAQP